MDKKPPSAAAAAAPYKEGGVIFSSEDAHACRQYNVCFLWQLVSGRQIDLVPFFSGQFKVTCLGGSLYDDVMHGTVFQNDSCFSSLSYDKIGMQNRLIYIGHVYTGKDTSEVRREAQ